MPTMTLVVEYEGDAIKPLSETMHNGQTYNGMRVVAAQCGNTFNILEEIESAINNGGCVSALEDVTEILSYQERYAMKGC